MSNPFDTLTPFGQDSASQVAFFDGIKTILNQLEGTAPIIIESTTVPTQVQMETLYLAAGVGRTLPVPTSQEFIWTIQGVVQGEYRTIDDLFVNINDTGVIGTDITGGQVYLMANGDIIANHQVSVLGTTTSKLTRVGRRTGTLTSLTLTPAMVGDFFSASPDRTKIAYVGLDGGGKQQIYTVPYPALTPSTQLTTSATGCDRPHWVGSKILYDESISSNSVIKIMNDNGTSQTTVFATGIAFGSFHWHNLSPDQTKVIYTKSAGGFFGYDVFMVNINGTGNTKFLDATSTTDNPHDELQEVTIPSWHPSGLWVYYGRRRKNINTLVSEQWYYYHFISPDTNHGISDIAPIVLNTPANWYNKNIITANPTGDETNLNADNAMLVPCYSSWELSNQVIFTSLTNQATTVAQSYPLIQIASQADGYTSTGKIYKTTQYVPDRGDFELIRHDIATGTETTFSISKAELKDFSHIKIVLHGQNTVGGSVLIKVIFNEDNTSGNYLNTDILANTTIVRAYQTLGDDAVICRGAGGTGVAYFSNEIFIPDIQATDAFKNAFVQMIYTNSAAAFALANYLSGDHQAIWKSTAAIETIRLISSQPLAANTIFSYYGIRGTARNEKDI